MMIGLIDTSISRLLARIKGANDSIDTISLTVQRNYLFRRDLPIIKNKAVISAILQSLYEN